jgi:hypothetical protein
MCRRVRKYNRTIFCRSHQPSERQSPRLKEPIELEQPSYLLLLACSQRKRPDHGLLPAIDRYDGVNFRVLKKAKREGYWPAGLRVLILSAKYGLLEADDPIEDYNLKMTRDMAKQFQHSVGHRLSAVLAQHEWKSVLVNLGKDYLPAIGTTFLKQSEPKIVYAQGGIGERMAQLKEWLKTIQTDESG